MCTYYIGGCVFVCYIGTYSVHGDDVICDFRAECNNLFTYIHWIILHISMLYRGTEYVMLVYKSPYILDAWIWFRWLFFRIVEHNSFLCIFISLCCLVSLAFALTKLSWLDKCDCAHCSVQSVHNVYWRAFWLFFVCLFVCLHIFLLFYIHRMQE